MSVEERIDALLVKADEAINKNDTTNAVEVLREASHLDPDNGQIKERWTAVLRREGGDDVLDVLRKYLGSHGVADGERVLQVLRQKQLDTTDARQAITLLLSCNTSPALLDSLIEVVASRNSEARKVIATRFRQNPTQFFTSVFELGSSSFDALVSTTFEASVWDSADSQKAAQRDVFCLSIAKLIAAGAEHLERAMRAVARLLAVTSDQVLDLIDTDEFDAIFANLDLRSEAALRSQTIFAASKYFEASPGKGEKMFAAFIHNRVGKRTIDDLIIAFSAAAAVFPIIPAIASRLFLVDGFVQQLVPNLERNWEDGAAGKWRSTTLETAALELLSAACVDKSCRESIKRYCSHWLQNLADERQGKHKALAALTLAKLNPESSQDVTGKLESLVLTGDAEADQAIEGLAYTTLEGRVKEEVSQNSKLLTSLVTALKERPSSLFGALTVFANITSYRVTLSEEQKKMAQLKAYANSQQPTPDDPLDDDAHVTARCKAVVAAEVVPALVVCCKQTISITNIALVAKILLSLSKEQRHRAVMAQQGAVRLLLQIRDRIGKTDQSSRETTMIQKHISHALARLLISLNPSHVFSSNLPASSAVTALIPLLSPDDEEEHRDLLPIFEALLALTNLASMPENSVRDQQLRLSWQQLEDHLLLSPNTMIQRASVEYLCNLMASPQCVAKFVGDGSKREPTRMRILLALADADDLATRRAAGGALAALTEWDAAVSIVLGLDNGVSRLLSMCEDESDEMKHRGLVCISNTIDAPGAVGAEGLTKIKGADGEGILKDALKQTRNSEILQLGVEVLKKLR